MENIEILDLIREILPYIASIGACIVAFWRKSKKTKEEKIEAKEQKLKNKLAKIEEKKTALTDDFLKNLKGGNTDGNETQSNA